ncbi:MAG: glutamyl-tRNA reductase [Archaeoglobaceae archaeon]|nr:glutamyl-tRNA reductase [Archaeoglobaceae archaeon]MDW8118688.1 glutamyl-tRNA reductase [Archaeoglobaceae archaeon]
MFSRKPPPISKSSKAEGGKVAVELGCLSVSHKRAKVEEIERVAKEEYFLPILSSYPFHEFAYIITCNRFEIYAIGFAIYENLLKLSKELEIEKLAEIHVGEYCLRHLMRVCAGIESMIVGENEILGQVRNSLGKCERRGVVGENLQRVFTKAIQVGSKIRRETAISRGALSIGSAAVVLAERVLGSLSGKKVLIVGAGEMGELVAKAIHRDVETILIANRTFSRAEALAKRLNGIAVRFDKLQDYLKICDVVISATSAPHIVISRQVVENAIKERDKKLVIIDIALPRDVEDSVRELKNVELFTIDDLRAISEENLKKRELEVKKAEEIIEKELEQFRIYLKDLEAKKAINAMYSLAGKFVDEEVEELYRKLAKLGLNDEVKPMLKAFAISLIKKFLSEPTLKLKLAARNGESELIDAILKIFGDGNVPESANEKTTKGKSERVVLGSKAES